MKFFCKLFKQDPNSREGVIMTTSWLSILVNLVSALLKIVIGLAVSSVAIVSEGLNNASDLASSVITIVGTKLAAKHPTRKHPFGYGRVEYLTSLVIAIMILFTGYEATKGAINSIFHPQEMDVSYLIIVIIAVSALVKFMLGTYMIKQGEKISSGSLVAVGKECRADCAVSLITIVSTAIFLVFHLSLDAYAGIITSLLIVKAGYEVLKDTVSDILGTAGNKELADKLYSIIRSNPIVINAADMILHNYGPDAYTGSVNIEVDHKMTVDELYANIHAMQLDIMHEHQIAMVFGIYAVDSDHEVLSQMRNYIAKYIREHDHIISFHALYLDSTNQDIYCDLVVDYDLQDWDALRTDFTQYMKNAYPDQRLELVVETEYV